jgi:hypothetical protein
MTQRNVVKTLLVAMAVACLGACSESYPGLDYDHTQGHDGIANQDSWSEKTPIMVFVNEQDIFTVKTRGLGAFETNDTAKATRLSNSTFYVFAFRKGHYTQSAIPALKNPTDYKWYYNAKNGPAGYYDTEQATCLLDGTDYNKGLPLYLRPQGGGLLHTAKEGDEEPEFFYSSVYQEVPYNFFSYYLDDIEPSQVIRDENGISLKVEIDGTQDVMCGGAPDLLEEIRNGKKNNVWKSLSDNEKHTIENIDGYCAFAAHRGLHPMINMTHQLTQLKFEAYPGDESSNNITITGITVESKYKGSLIVAANDVENVGFKFDEDRKALALRDSADGKSDLPPLKEYKVEYKDEWKDIKWYNRKKVDIGSSIMLAPDSAYVLTIHYKEWQSQTIDDSNPTEINRPPVHYLINAPKTEMSKSPNGGYWFAPGVVYPIQIAIYGSQKFEIYTNIEGWKQSDEAITIDDPDQGWK